MDVEDRMAQQGNPAIINLWVSAYLQLLRHADLQGIYFSRVTGADRSGCESPETASASLRSAF